MIVKKQGGMTEFIPSPQEKRDALVRDNFLVLLDALHRRITKIEHEIGLFDSESLYVSRLLRRVKHDEKYHLKLHSQIANKKH